MEHGHDIDGRHGQFPAGEAEEEVLLVRLLGIVRPDKRQPRRKPFEGAHALVNGVCADSLVAGWGEGRILLLSALLERRHVVHDRLLIQVGAIELLGSLKTHPRR
jgi:hypothetical protein